MKMDWATDETEKDFLKNNYLSMERKMLLHFLSNENNKTMYRILSGQILLSKFKEPVDETILKIALNEAEEYNNRADATDLLLKYALSSETKAKAKEIILELGRIKGEVRSIYDNAQNAHSEAIENSATECLLNLSQEPLATYPNINNKPIDFEFVEKQLKFAASMGWNAEKIEAALNRIALDNALYSTLHISLKSALVLVYSFILQQEHEDRFNLSTRLLQELEESAGICSTGIMERIVNTLSGFDERFGLKISYEDQIKGNLAGRLNAKIMSLTSSECLHKTNQKFCNCKSLVCDYQKFLLNDELKTTMKFKSPPCDSCMLCLKVECLHGFLCTKICTFNEDLMNDILDQMQLLTSDFHKRGKFLLFFRTYIGDIMQDMKKDFVENNLLDVPTFDLYFRKAVMSYEGEN